MLIKRLSRFGLALILAAGFLTLSACDSNEGAAEKTMDKATGDTAASASPLEQTEKALDNTMKDAKETMDKAIEGETMDKAAEDTGGMMDKAAEDAGGMMDKAAEDAGKTMDKAIEGAGAAIDATGKAVDETMEKAADKIKSE